MVTSRNGKLAADPDVRYAIGIRLAHMLSDSFGGGNSHSGQPVVGRRLRTCRLLPRTVVSGPASVTVTTLRAAFSSGRCACWRSAARSS
jgi:hypothetical protein